MTICIFFERFYLRMQKAKHVAIDDLRISHSNVTHDL